MTHVLGERLKELVKDADREKTLKNVTNAVAKEKGKVAEAAEKKAQASEKARQLVEGKLAKAEDWLGGIELKLAEAASLNLAQADQIAEKQPLKSAKTNGTMRASWTPRNQQRLLSIKHGFMGSRRDGWRPSKR